MAQALVTLSAYHARKFSLFAAAAADAQRSMLASMLGFMKKSKRKRNTNELEGIYLSQLDTDGLDPEIVRLYLPHSNCMDSYKREGKLQIIAFALNMKNVSVHEKESSILSAPECEKRPFFGVLVELRFKKVELSLALTSR